MLRVARPVERDVLANHERCNASDLRKTTKKRKNEEKTRKTKKKKRKLQLASRNFRKTKSSQAPKQRKCLQEIFFQKIPSWVPTQPTESQTPREKKRKSTDETKTTGGRKETKREAPEKRGTRPQITEVFFFLHPGVSSLVPVYSSGAVMTGGPSSTGRRPKPTDQPTNQPTNA